MVIFTILAHDQDNSFTCINQTYFIANKKFTDKYFHSTICLVLRLLIYFLLDLRNAFKLVYGYEEWILGSETHEMKFDFISSMKSAIKTVIEH